jgi:hypothetical protein
VAGWARAEDNSWHSSARGVQREAPARQSARSDRAGFCWTRKCGGCPMSAQESQAEPGSSWRRFLSHSPRLISKLPLSQQASRRAPHHGEPPALRTKVVVARGHARGCVFVRIFQETILIMRFFTSGLSLILLSSGFLGLAGCAEDNEAAIREQASRAKGTIPGSRTAQARTQEEFYEITPGVQGAGTATGPRPDQGKGYPGRKAR